MRTDSRDDVVFGPAWFARHQRTLLWLLNAPIIGWWFRWVLCIRACDVGYARPIVELGPHYYTIANDDGTLTTDFRTHEKYGKRLYYGLLPLWRLFHAWDMAVANPLCPTLNAGFDTLTTYPDPDPETATIDGTVGRYDAVAGESWNSLVTSAGNLADNSFVGMVHIGAAGTTNEWKRLVRSVFLFNTASIGGSSSVSAATLSIYGTALTNNRSLTATVDIYTATPASNTALATTDYANVGTTSQTGGATISTGSWNTAGYNDFVFSAAGCGNIALTGVSKFSLRNANYDVANSAPTWTFGDETVQFSGSWAEESGTTQDPKLVVTYSLASRLVPRNNLRPRIFAPGRAR